MTIRCNYFGYAILFIICFLVSLNNGQNPFDNTYALGFDTTIYQYIGHRMWQGELPYRDIFDHKGPVIYVWNMLGQGIHPMWGQWLLELMILYVSALLMFKIATLYLQSFISLLLAGIIVLFIPKMDTIGNTESLTNFLYFIIIYLFLDYFQTDRLEKFKCFLLGGIAALILFIKPTFLCCIGVLYGVLFLDLLLKKKHNDLQTLIIYILYGFLIITSIQIAIMAYLGILKDFYELYIVFNFNYIAHQQTKHTIIQIALFYLKQPIVVCSLVACVILCILWKKQSQTEKWLNFSFISAFLVSLLILFVSLTDYQHNSYILYPWSFLLFMALGKLCHQRKKGLSLVLLLILGMGLYYKAGNIYNRFPQSLESKRIKTMLQKYLAPDEKMQVLGWNFCRLLLLSDRPSATKFVFTDVINDMYPDKLYSELAEKHPLVIVIVTWQIEPYTSYIQRYWPDFFIQYQQFYQNPQYTMYGNEEFMQRWKK